MRARAIVVAESTSPTPAPKADSESIESAARAIARTKSILLPPAPKPRSNSIRRAARATPSEEPMGLPPAPDLLTIRSLGSLLDDLEQVLVMNGNRIGAGEREHGEALPHLID